MNGNYVSHSPSPSPASELGQPAGAVNGVHHQKPVGISGQGYAKNVAKLMKLMTDLRASGAQAVIDLPQISVIGNQSAGKSSLVEAISGITLPRAAGTCTRCPFECRLQYSQGPWRCQVLLRYEVDLDGKRHQEVKEEKFGDELTDKAALEDRLRRAQLAILNPNVDPTRFLEQDGTHLQKSAKQLSFSRNVVCVDIYGPDVTNLSFIDLPGIISNVAEGEDRNNIELIKGLVQEHIKGNALILLVITMKDDIENQSAAFLAKEADPSGIRTIGVCTKPDTLEEGTHVAWMNILNGNSHPLTHGYFVTKQPASHELKDRPDHVSAREKERSFFSSDAHWRDVSEAIRDRMGVPKLTARLSKLLSQLIETRLPELRKEARSQLTKIIELLKALPPAPPQHPVPELIRLVSGFCQDVRSGVLGLEGFEELMQLCRPAYHQFKEDVWSTRPRFSPFRKSEVPEEGSKADKEAQAVMYVDEVAAHVKKYLTRQLPYNVPFPAKTALIRKCLDAWPPRLQECFLCVRNAFFEYVKFLSAKYFGLHKNGGLDDHARIIIERQFEIVDEELKKRINWLILLESHPFTQNDDYFSNSREKHLASFQDSQQSRNRVPKSKEATTSLKLTTPINFSASAFPQPAPPTTFGDVKPAEFVKPAELAKPVEADTRKYEQELIVMAEVMAYFNVAYKRIIDDFPRIIDIDFLHAFSQNIHPALIEGLGLGGEHSATRAASYLSEDQDTSLRRRDLEVTKARLEGVLSKLFTFGTSTD